MEALQFLGGKYNQLEQLSLGPVQTYGGRNAASGAPVFIHRVSTVDEPVAQANLLKLMTAALVRSGEVKRLVVDFGEDEGFLYVVTENNPRCRSLREWLHAELNGLPALTGQPASSLDANIAALGEFARLFQPVAVPDPGSATEAPPVDRNTEEPTPLEEQPPLPPPAPHVPTGTASPGEFNRLFAESEAEAQRFANLHAAPLADAPSEPEPVLDSVRVVEKPVPRVFQPRPIAEAPEADPAPRRPLTPAGSAVSPRSRNAHAPSRPPATVSDVPLKVEQPVIRPGTPPAPAAIPVPAFATAKPPKRGGKMWIVFAILAVLAILVAVYLMFYR